jgi:galactose mutarotase-like enzyme
MAETVSIRSEGLAAEINVLGAELWRLADAAGRDLLWDGDAAFWTGRAPILFPVVGGSAGGKVTVEGRDLPMDRHGFARRQPFAVVEHSASAVRLRLEANAATRAIWPFDFRLDMVFSVAGSRLEMVAEATNLDARPMPASFGYHPALRWPLPYGEPRAAHRIRFDAPEPGPIHRIDASGLVKPDGLPTPVDGYTLMLDDALFEDDVLIWYDLTSRGLTYGAPGAPALTVTFPGMPMLGVWTKPRAGYVCVEPWQGTADNMGFAGDIAGRPGMLKLLPGETRRFPMGIALGAEPMPG